MQTVAQLSALTRLYLTARPAAGTTSAVVPRCSELACLHSRSLQDLTVSQKQVCSAYLCLQSISQLSSV